MTSINGSGSGVDECEGEEQEDSSSLDLLEAGVAQDQVKIDSPVPNKVEDELSEFRQQWQRELEHTPSPQRTVKKQVKETQETTQETIEVLTDEEKAKKLFLLGVDFERRGKLYEAIQHYKKAIQIVPDVETRLYENVEPKPESSDEEEEIEVEVRGRDIEDSDDEVVEGEELLPRLQRILAKKGGHFCQPAFPTNEAHLSWLPSEVLHVVLRWLVGAELDAAALERAAAVCRGLYVAAREPHIWRAICIKTWGIECGTPRAHGYSSWREMYVERPRLSLHGCYISKTTYLRLGENSFQDHCYRPWYLIDYYRYLRFFPEGHVLMWTTPDEPAACVAHLKYRAARNNLGIMAGHYRLIGDKVVVVIKKPATEKLQAGHTRFRARRKETVEQHDNIYHLELTVRSSRSRRNAQLVWTHYAVSTRRDQWTTFDLDPGKFPPFAFSRVRSYTAEARAPLVCGAQ
ncbi:F-box only protein 9 isoform X2 [Aricia agestis]|uniref:F-box only protein 9 isoform X1 n=1 Tax=Aricia agestis TaxID=91739 RepID=UPI001C205F4C|nr:F-box only protein 9 isoform X1 [Aricia agestis]XP_041968686.1 F-box only protein 9 isoform X2 [Aricia agestis]